MSASTLAFSLLFYGATAVFVLGLGARLVRYARTPAPLKIATTPAPITRGGAALRVLGEAILFQSLFRANPGLWIVAWAFHVALLLIILRHLRYFVEPLWAWVALIQPFGIYAGWALIAGLVALWVRRLANPRVRQINAWSDHLMLALLLFIAATGLAMTFVEPTDVVGVKAFFLGLIHLDWQPLPEDLLLQLHLLGVAGLMLVFPFSKLLHGPALFFSPTRNQTDNPRERRHLAPWAAALEQRGIGTQSPTAEGKPND